MGERDREKQRERMGDHINFNVVAMDLQHATMGTAAVDMVTSMAFEGCGCNSYLGCHNTTALKAVAMVVVTVAMINIDVSINVFFATIVIIFVTMVEQAVAMGAVDIMAI